MSSSNATMTTTPTKPTTRSIARTENARATPGDDAEHVEPDTGGEHRTERERDGVLRVQRDLLDRRSGEDDPSHDRQMGVGVGVPHVAAGSNPVVLGPSDAPTPVRSDRSTPTRASRRRWPQRPGALDACRSSAPSRPRSRRRAGPGNGDGHDDLAEGHDDDEAVPLREMAGRTIQSPPPARTVPTPMMAKPRIQATTRAEPSSSEPAMITTIATTIGTEYRTARPVDVGATLEPEEHRPDAHQQDRGDRGGERNAGRPERPGDRGADRHARHRGDEEERANHAPRCPKPRSPTT